MAKQVLAWKCRYCGVIKKSETIATRHERSCLNNPEAKNCIVCVESYTGYGGNNVLTCTARRCDCSRAISANCDKFQRILS